VVVVSGRLSARSRLRRRALARWERSLLPPRRRTFAALAAAIESALRPAPPEAPGAAQSPPGA